MADNDQLLNQLKAKYQSVISAAPGMGIRLTHVHVENNKLLIRAAMPNEASKNDIWNEIKRIDSGYSDLSGDISVDSTLPQPKRTYTVVKGDTLGKIAQQFYGKAGDYTKIVAANPSIKNPDLIHPGDVFVIPD